MTWDMSEIFITPMKVGFDYLENGEYGKAVSYFAGGLVPYVAVFALLYLIFDRTTRSVVYVKGRVTRANFVQDKREFDGYDELIYPPHWNCSVEAKVGDVAVTFNGIIFSEHRPQPKIGEEVEARIVIRRLTSKVLSTKIVA